MLFEFVNIFSLAPKINVKTYVIRTFTGKINSFSFDMFTYRILNV